jgi:spore coat protein T
MEHFILNPEEQLISDNQTYFTDERQPYHYPRPRPYHPYYPHYPFYHYPYYPRPYYPRPYPYYPWYGYGGGYGY